MTYSFFVINAIFTVELFLVFKGFEVLLAGLVIHLIGALVCLREPRFFDLWIASGMCTATILAMSTQRCGVPPLLAKQVNLGRDA